LYCAVVYWWQANNRIHCLFDSLAFSTLNKHGFSLSAVTR
jgi:hypothetical protein